MNTMMTATRMALMTAALLVCGGASAQWDPGTSASIGMDYGQIALSQSILTGTRMLGNMGDEALSSGESDGLSPHMQRYCAKYPDKGVCRRNGASAGNLAVNSTALQYRPSPSVSTALRQELAEHMAKANPAQAQNIRQALSTDAMWKEFSRLLSSYGYSSTNLADVMTGYFTAYWEIVNGIDASSNASGVRATRDRFAAALASNPNLLAMSDADKQRFAESMGYFAVVAAAGMNEAMKAGNRAGVAELQKAVHQTMLQTYGVDLKQVKLTSQGFVPG